MTAPLALVTGGQQGIGLGIAQALAARIEDGASLMLDTGTTTSFVARALLQHRRLTVAISETEVRLTF